jgi:hypothetical protein
MDYRTGKCSQCGAEYKVPASFAHNVARCKVCKGVVHLSAPHEVAKGAAPADASEGTPAVPARKVVPKPAAPRAVRPAAPEAKKGFPVPPPARAAVPPKAGEPTPRPAPAEDAQPADKPRGTLERLKGERRAQQASPSSAHAPSPAPAAPAAAHRPAAATAAASREVHGHASSHGREGAHGHAAGAARHAHGHHGHEKKPPVAGILSGVGLVVVGAVLVLFRHQLFGGGAAPEVGLAASTAPTPAPAGAPVPGAAPAAAGAAREPAADSPETAAAEKPETKPAAKPEKKAVDPNSVDLASIPDFGPTPDTSAEEWAQMNEWMAQWMDVEAGAAGNRAKLKLLEQKRRAVPAILNFFKKQDFATKEGRSNGDQCQKSLMQICNGTNFDWRYADEAAGRPLDFPEDVWFCKKVVESWVKAWKQVEENIEAWINLAKLKDKDPAEAERLRQMFGGQASGEGSDPAAAKGDDDLEVD